VGVRRASERGRETKTEAKRWRRELTIERKANTTAEDVDQTRTPTEAIKGYCHAFFLKRTEE
jgi:hypothetical protein